MKKNKGTIFCIHGNSSSSKVYDHLVNYDLNLDIIAIDLPGHGSNQLPQNDLNFTVDSLKYYLTEKINKIEGDIILIGNSLGGHLAIEIANDINNLVSLIIMGTPPIKKPINFTEVWNPVPEINNFFTENLSLNEINKTISLLTHNSDVNNLLIDDFINTNSKIRKQLSDEISKNNLMNEYDIFKNLNIPSYIIHGDKDPIINKNYLINCANESLNCEYIEIKDCGHFPSVEKPDEFINIIKEISNKIFNYENSY